MSIFQKYIIPLAVLVLLLNSCSKESYVEEIYPEYKATLNYDSTTLYFPNSFSTLGGNKVGRELSGCLRREDGQRLCLEFVFDTLISSFDLVDSLQGKTFYFVSNKDYPSIKLFHEKDYNDYTAYKAKLDVGGNYFLHINEVKPLPIGDPVFNVQFVRWVIEGNFLSQFENNKGKLEETSGKFLMLMEYIEFIP